MTIDSHRIARRTMYVNVFVVILFKKCTLLTHILPKLPHLRHLLGGLYHLVTSISTISPLFPYVSIYIVGGGVYV